MSVLEFATHALTLQRFPVRKNETLQAWDAADEYLLDTLLSDIDNFQHILILNDNFGALTSFLSVLASPATQITCMSDSFISAQATLSNLKANGIDRPIQQLSSMEAMPEDADCIVMKVPRALSFLEHQLAQIAQASTASTRIIAGAKAKDIHTSTLKLFEKYVGETKTSLAKKKARLIFCQRDESLNLPVPSPAEWKLDKTGYTILNHANVFSRASLDIGGRFLIDTLPTIPSLLQSKRIVDLGCGNGVVGISAAHLTDAHVTCVDESHMAVASAQANFEATGLTNKFDAYTDDCLSRMPANSTDLVLCNPPFHQQNTISDHIAWQMFNDAKRVLQKEGHLVIVGNRHLQYHTKLKRLFGNVTQLAANKKFVILSAEKI